MPPPLRPALLAAMLAFAVAPSPAELLRYSASSDMVGGAGAFPEALTIGSWVELTFVFDSSEPPISVTTTTATYAGLYGVTVIDAFETRLLFDVLLTITKDTTDPYPTYEYLFSGKTLDGWTLSHYAYSDDPSFVPSLTLPTVTPPFPPDPFAYTAGYVDVLGPGLEWWAYSDSGFWFDVHAVPFVAELPLIAAQPLPTSIRPGKMAKFDVRARSGDGTRLSYQWLKDGLPVVGATSAKLKIKKATAADAGIYRVLISNDAGTVISEAAALSLR